LCKTRSAKAGREQDDTLTMIYMHGNSEDAGSHADHYSKHLAGRINANILLPEYPGYGPVEPFNQERATAEGANRAARNAIKYVFNI